MRFRMIFAVLFAFFVLSIVMAAYTSQQHKNKNGNKHVRATISFLVPNSEIRAPPGFLI